MIVTLLILIFIILFLVALIWPKKLTALGGGKPHRGKAFLFYFIPIIVLLIVIGTISENELKLAETEPEKVNYLLQDDAGLSEWPAFTGKVINIDRWDLSDNDLKDISEDVRNLTNLRKLELANNPISQIPEWLTELPELKSLDLRGTKIDSTSLETVFALKEKGVKVRFTNTPLLPEVVEEKGSEEEQLKAEADHTESFWQFAERRLFYGNEGKRRLFKKGELYYGEGIEVAKVDSLGVALEDIGIFTDDKEVTVKLIKVDDLYQVKMVTIYDKAEDMSEDELISWQLISAMIKAQVFDEEKMELHLCDDRLNVYKEINLD